MTKPLIYRLCDRVRFALYRVSALATAAAKRIPQYVSPDERAFFESLDGKTVLFLPDEFSAAEKAERRAAAPDAVFLGNAEARRLLVYRGWG